MEREGSQSAEPALSRMAPTLPASRTATGHEPVRGAGSSAAALARGFGGRTARGKGSDAFEGPGPGDISGAGSSIAALVWLRRRRARSASGGWACSGRVEESKPSTLNSSQFHQGIPSHH